ncbi:MAG: hypothetical protein JNL10_14380 [Verrucomicrobiales bacterium]|nr:hypothetical protein [Verrucomicrobiales bacterium]
MNTLAGALDRSVKPQNHAGTAAPSTVTAGFGVPGVAPENSPERFREIFAAAVAGDPTFADDGCPYLSDRPVPTFSEINEWARRHQVRIPSDDEIFAARKAHEARLIGERSWRRFDPRNNLRSKAADARKVLADLEAAERAAEDHGRKVQAARENVQARMDGLALAVQKLESTTAAIEGLKQQTADFADASFPAHIGQMTGPLTQLIAAERWAADLEALHIPRLERDLANAEAELAKLTE